MLKRFLQDRSLDRQVQYDYHDGKLQLNAILDADEMERFRPILTLLKTRTGSRIRIEVNLKTVEQSLPFRVVQVVSGPVPEILTRDGHRLFLGDSIEGYMLVAINKQNIIFEGRRHVELPW
ncbi:hypothetical protein WT37_04380 [Burkholderia territorii]|nr:hypothetical protein WT37_04380 [Burkholderia territorii]